MPAKGKTNQHEDQNFPNVMLSLDKLLRDAEIKVKGATIIPLIKS